jgi:hypothetical protein
MHLEIFMYMARNNKYVSFPFLSNFFPSYTIRMSTDSLQMKQIDFERAATRGDLETVKQYLADPDLHGCELGKVQYMCLHTFISEGLIDMVKCLITHPRWVKHSTRGEYEYTYGSMDNCSIVHAYDEGHYDIVRLLMKYGIGDPNTLLRLLRKAACDNNSKILRLLLRDSRVDLSDGGSNIPIEHAAEHENLALISALIADPRVQAAPMSDKVRSLIVPALNGAAMYRRGHAVHAWYALRAARRARAAARRAAAAAVTSE